MKLTRADPSTGAPTPQRKCARKKQRLESLPTQASSAKKVDEESAKADGRRKVTLSLVESEGSPLGAARCGENVAEMWPAEREKETNRAHNGWHDLYPCFLFFFRGGWREGDFSLFYLFVSPTCL